MLSSEHEWDCEKQVVCIRIESMWEGFIKDRERLFKGGATYYIYIKECKNYNSFKIRPGMSIWKVNSHFNFI